MNFPWPVTDDELVLDDALDIAMRYFDLPQDEEQYASVESFARGVHHGGLAKRRKEQDSSR